MALFPNIPFVPGVPSLPRNPFGSFPALVLLVRDVLSFFAGFIGPQWGLFSNGFPAIMANSVVSLDYRQTWTVSTYPVEQGAFESYDKVQTPFDVRIRFTSGGSAADRQALLESIASVAGSLELFDVVTPDAIYLSVNVTHYDYKRAAANGVGLLIVDVWCLQVRVTASASFSNTQAPSGAGQVNDGQVSAVPATPEQSTRFLGGAT